MTFCELFRTSRLSTDIDGSVLILLSRVLALFVALLTPSEDLARYFGYLNFTVIVNMFLSGSTV